MTPAHRPRVLVVDDELCVREALTAALHPTYVGHAAASGAEALACLRAQPIAAIILDALLENEQGLDLVPPFRAIRPVRILVLTGHSSEELAIRAVWAGVDGYLKKPVGVPDLHDALDRLLPPERGPADLAARARRQLDEQAGKPVRAAIVAGQLGVSEVHLRRCFRDAYGKTLNRYLTEMRLQRAATLLLTTPHGVERIALEVGFPNVRWFNRCFKRAFGTTPRAYRAGERLPGTGEGLRGGSGTGG